MRKLNHYVARSVIGAIALVLLVVLCLDLIGTLIDQLTSLRGNYTLAEAFIYTGLSSFRRIYEYLPFACLIGCLVGLGLLANNSELTVMRAAGVSVGRITWMVLKPVLLFIALGLTLGEYVTPYTDQLAESRRAIALGDSRGLQAQQGMWNREGNEFMHFNAVQPHGVLYGVTRYQFDDQHRLTQASFSRQVMYQGDYWLEEGVDVTYLQGDTATAAAHYMLRRWDSALTPTLLNILALPPEGLSIRNLHYYSNYLEEQSLENSEYDLAFWQKVLQPLATASLVLIAISFVFGPLREVTMGQRIFSGIVFGIVFQITQSMLGPSSLVFGFPPVLAVLAPIIFCFVLGLYLLKRAR